jgi:anti-anti-sigma factor
MSRSHVEIKIVRHFAGPAVKDTVSEIKEHIGSENPVDLTLDFSETEFIDSSGIGSLVTLARDSKDRETGLVLKNLNDDIYDLFQDIGLDRIFTIERGGGVRAAEVDLLATSVDIRLDLKKEILDDVCVFELSGVLSHPAGSEYLKQQLLLSLDGFRKILLDMEDLTFFDSMSLGTVISINNLLRETGGSMSICSVNYIVNDLFSTLNVGSIIPLFPSRQEALEAWEIANA